MIESKRKQFYPPQSVSEHRPDVESELLYKNVLDLQNIPSGSHISGQGCSC